MAVHRFVWALLLTCALGQTISSQGAAKLLPVDDASQDSAFLTYRRDLLNVVQARNSSRLVALLGPSVRDESAQDVPRESFVRLFTPADSSYWSGLETALALGGTMSHGGSRFCAPYVFSAYPREFPEALRAEEAPWVITGAGVNLRQKPEPAAKVVGKLSYDLVKMLAPAPFGWVQIETLDGKSGFVARAFIRSKDELHACFEKGTTGWAMIEFSRQ